MNKEEIVVFWFRRDFRLHDNCGLYKALNAGFKVLPIFIFDDSILSELPKNDSRVQFIHNSLGTINTKLNFYQSSLLILKGNVLDIWKKLLSNYNIKNVYCNKDYELYAIQRDLQIKNLCLSKNIEFNSFKDQVIFEENEILKDDNSPYKVYTPYKKKWLKKYEEINVVSYPSEEHLHHFLHKKFKFPSLSDIGFVNSTIEVPVINSNCISLYNENRDIPSIETSNTSTYLRFGNISVRNLFKHAIQHNTVFASELIWREFFMQILYHFPRVVLENFKTKYNTIQWRNNKNEFKLWCEGKTGYPFVDAGMRQLNKTGLMHNRVRMVTASFLCKHLLIDWRWGEAYFAKKLLDFELSSNNGNWQWVAGTGCDAAPYYRIFNPITQLQKFDPNLIYVNKWIPNFKPYEIEMIVDHKKARERYLKVMKQI